MFAKKRDYTKEVEATYKLVAEAVRGSIAKHETIESVTQFDRGTVGYITVIRKVRRLLRDKRGFWLLSVPSVGYRLATIDEQLQKEPARFQRRRQRLMRKEAECIGCISGDELDETQKRFQAARVAQVAEEVNDLKARRAIVTSWISSPETLPKPQRKAIA